MEFGEHGLRDLLMNRPLPEVGMCGTNPDPRETEVVAHEINLPAKGEKSISMNSHRTENNI